MHIPDGFLSAGVAAGTWAIAGIGVAAATRAERVDPNPVPSGTLGAVAAFVFAAQMVNIPVAPGVSGHLVGAALATAIVGPWRAVLVMATVLTVQAVLFQDGGLSSLGANLVDMGLAGSLATYACSIAGGRRAGRLRGFAIGTMFGAFAATISAAALVAVWLAMSGLYPLQGILPLMLVTHAAVGALEAALTGAIVVTLLRWRPDIVRGIDPGGQRARPGAFAGGLLIVAIAVAAFLAPLASALPDGLQRTADRLGFADRAQALWAAPFSGSNPAITASARAATLAAGIGGTLVVAAASWLISRGLSSSRHASHR